MKCSRCGGIEFYTEHKGQHLGVYCTNCNAWQKWQAQPENEGRTKESYRDEYLSKQQATPNQVYYIRNLLRQNTINKYQASKIIEILNGESYEPAVTKGGEDVGETIP